MLGMLKAFHNLGMRDQFEMVLNRVRASEFHGRELRQFAMQLLSELDGYDWCGIYALNKSHLELDAFVGAPTDHTTIAIGVGVCGTAVAEDRNQIVEDVRLTENYLACSLDTRSEIVTLIRRHGVVVGQIDIDGHRVGAFGKEDESFLDQLGDLLALRWEDEFPA